VAVLQVDLKKVVKKTVEAVKVIHKNMVQDVKSNTTTNPK
jgi:hypothetical protein